MIEKISAFTNQCKRVWYVLKKPNMKEFSSISKISVITILALGLIGFIITLVMNLF